MLPGPVVFGYMHKQRYVGATWLFNQLPKRHYTAAKWLFGLAVGMQHCSYKAAWPAGVYLREMLPIYSQVHFVDLRASQ